MIQFSKNIRACFLLLFLQFCMLAALAQVPNDDIEQAIGLPIGTTFTSNTSYCTVQPECVDEKLTGKCIEYHNDQWFTFNSGKHHELYINISGQHCVKVLGVQLVVIKGIPCRPDTYTVLACASLANQDDIHVKLTGLDEEQDYLLNVDGYLHDFCSFQIQVSPEPQGVSYQPVASLPAETTTGDQDNSISIRWQLPDSLARVLTGFEVRKRNELVFKSEVVAQLPVEKDAYGRITRDTYTFTDTLTGPARRYYYRLVGMTTEGRELLLRDFEFTRREPSAYSRPFSLELNYRNDTPITVLVMDAATRKLLRSQNINFDKKKHSRFYIETGSLRAAGIKRIRVEVANNRDRSRKTYFFDL